MTHHRLSRPQPTARPGHHGPHRHLGAAALVGAVVIWGSTYVVIKGALDDIGPIALALARFAVVLPMMWPLATRRGLRRDHLREPRMWLFGATGVAVYFGLQNLGIAFTTAGSAALIAAAIPGLTAVMAYLLLRERPSPVRWAGIALSTVGAAVIVGSGLELGSWEAVGGNLLVVASAIAWAAYTVQSRSLGASHRAVVSTTASFVTGTVILVPFTAVEAVVIGLPAATPAMVGAVLYLGLLGSGLAIGLWNYGVSRTEASAAGAFVNLVPAVGLAFALGVGERISSMQIAGGLIAALGVLLVHRGRRSPDQLPVVEARTGGPELP